MRSPPLRAAAILVAASLLHSDHSRGDDVLAVVGQNSTSDVQRLLISAGMVTPGAGSAIGVAWLANKIAPYGEQLHTGDVVLAGSFTRPVNAARGDAFEADYGALGRFHFKFV